MYRLRARVRHCQSLNIVSIVTDRLTDRMGLEPIGTH